MSAIIFLLLVTFSIIRYSNGIQKNEEEPAVSNDPLGSEMEPIKSIGNQLHRNDDNSQGFQYLNNQGTFLNDFNPSEIKLNNQHVESSRVANFRTILDKSEKEAGNLHNQYPDIIYNCNTFDPLSTLKNMIQYEIGSELQKSLETAGRKKRSANPAYEQPETPRHYYAVNDGHQWGTYSLPENYESVPNYHHVSHHKPLTYVNMPEVPAYHLHPPNNHDFNLYNDHHLGNHVSPHHVSLPRHHHHHKHNTNVDIHYLHNHHSSGQHPMREHHVKPNHQQHMMHSGSNSHHHHANHQGNHQFVQHSSQNSCGKNACGCHCPNGKCGMDCYSKDFNHHKEMPPHHESYYPKYSEPLSHHHIVHLVDQTLNHSKKPTHHVESGHKGKSSVITKEISKCEKSDDGEEVGEFKGRILLTPNGMTLCVDYLSVPCFNN